MHGNDLLKRLLLVRSSHFLISIARAHFLQTRELAESGFLLGPVDQVVVVGFLDEHGRARGGLHVPDLALLLLLALKLALAGGGRVRRVFSTRVPLNLRRLEKLDLRSHMAIGVSLDLQWLALYLHQGRRAVRVIDELCKRSDVLRRLAIRFHGLVVLVELKLDQLRHFLRLLPLVFNFLQVFVHSAAGLLESIALTHSVSGALFVAVFALDDCDASGLLDCGGRQHGLPVCVQIYARGRSPVSVTSLPTRRQSRLRVRDLFHSCLLERSLKILSAAQRCCYEGSCAHLAATVTWLGAFRIAFLQIGWYEEILSEL